MDDSDDLEQRIERLTARIAKATEAIAQPKPPQRATMSVKEKSAFIAEHGAEKYLALPWGQQ